MKYYVLYLIPALVLLSFCQTKKPSIDTSQNITPTVKKEITIYGSENCDHCIDFRKQVDSLGIAYIFKDVEADEALFNELSMKIQQANYGGYVSFPVIDIDNKIYVKPEFDQFLRLVSE